MNRKFYGPVWPRVGPDWNEPISRFWPEFLERECADDPRVRAWLAARPEALANRIAHLERELASLKSRARNETRNSRPKKRAKPSYRGVPV